MPNCTLYVPVGTKALYENADVWKEFGKMVEVVRENPEMNNMLLFDDFSAFGGRRVVMPIKMNNTDAIAALQFDLYLPDGISIAQDEDGFDMIEVGERTTPARHNTIESALQPDGGIRIMCASTKNLNFNGNEGTVLNITLNIGEDITDGDYIIMLKNITMSTNVSQGYEQPYYNATVSVASYEMGDLNKDHSVNVVDYTAMVDIIMHPETTKFPLVLADFDGNGSVNVIDLTTLTNKIMHPTPTATKARMASRKTANGSDKNRLSLIPFTINPGETKEISLHMFNEDAISAYQTDLVLPEGIEIAKDEDDFYLVEVATRTTSKKHNTMEAEPLADGSIRLMCASSKNSEFAGNEGEVATITVKASDTLEPGAYDITLKNNTLSTADSQGFEPASCNTSALVGSPDIASVTLNGDFIADAITELNTALAANKSIASLDLTNAVSIDGETAFATGNKNLLVYVAEGTSIANGANAVAGDVCESLVLTDGYPFCAPKAFTATEASYKRTLGGSCATVCLPFAPTAGNIKFYELSSVNGNVLNFTSTGSPLANTPYLIRAECTEGTATASNVGINASVAGTATTAGWTLNGTFGKKAFTSDDGVYALSAGKLYRNTGTLTISPLRAYFTFSGDGVKEMNISLDGETTGISFANDEEGGNESRFNLNGQAVGSDYRGIVIINGRKEFRK